MSITKPSFGRKCFMFFNYFFITILALSCFFPLLHVLSLSFSSSRAATSGLVGLFPVDFTTASYNYVANKPEFWQSFFVSIKRLAISVPIQMLITVLTAYPLSKDDGSFRYRNIYTWFFIITMLFSGGLIPWYMVIKSLHLIDSIWALVLPFGLQVYYVILLLNFFRNIPKGIEQAAFIDGASPWTVLWKIYIPLSKPALATLILFSAVATWNSWFDGLILMNKTTNYPLQSYLQTVVVAKDLTLITSADISSISEISDRTNKAAQIFMAMLPIMCVYPFLQKYFTTGIVLGSVKE